MLIKLLIFEFAACGHWRSTVAGVGVDASDKRRCVASLAPTCWLIAGRDRVVLAGLRATMGKTASVCRQALLPLLEPQRWDL